MKSVLQAPRGVCWFRIAAAFSSFSSLSFIRSLSPPRLLEFRWVDVFLRLSPEKKGYASLFRRPTTWNTLMPERIIFISFLMTLLWISRVDFHCRNLVLTRYSLVNWTYLRNIILLYYIPLRVISFFDLHNVLDLFFKREEERFFFEVSEMRLED